MRRSLYGLMFSLLLLMLVALTGAVSADDGVTRSSEDILVLYEGNMVSLAELEAKGPTYCHDARGKGQLTCFATSQEGDLDLIRRGLMPLERAAQFEALGHTHLEAVDWEPSSPSHPEQLSTTSSSQCYTKLWSAIGYSGSWRVLCNDYNDLRSISFNDVTSSVEVWLYYPKFWSAINFSGTWIAPPSDVADLRDYYFNDEMSSAELI
jgi:hypothetical protein